jgi:hypothetical protein
MRQRRQPAASRGSTRRGFPRPAAATLDDDALVGFAMWCSWNPPSIVGDPVVVRRVFDVYAEASRNSAAR